MIWIHNPPEAHSSMLMSPAIQSSALTSFEPDFKIDTACEGDLGVINPLNAHLSVRFQESQVPAFG